MKEKGLFEPTSPEEIARKLLLRAKFEALQAATDVIAEYRGDWDWATATIKGLTSVILDDPDRGIYEYDLSHPGAEDEKLRVSFVRLLDKLELFLGAIQVGVDEWSIHDDRGPNVEEFRVITFKTNVPGIQISHVEYRYPKKLEWGVSVRRVIERVSPTEEED